MGSQHPTSERTASARILELVLAGEATSRGALARLVGAPRSVVSARLQALAKAGLLADITTGTSQLAAGTGYLVSVDLGARPAKLAVFDIELRELDSAEWDPDIDSGPESCLLGLLSRVELFATEPVLKDRHFLGLSVGLPGMVNFSVGEMTNLTQKHTWRGSVCDNGSPTTSTFRSSSTVAQTWWR